MNDEYNHGIVQEPDTSCSEIDKAIQKATNGLSSLKSAYKLCGCLEEDPGIEDALSDAEYDLEDMESCLEYCRSQCEALRAWGNEWKEEALHCHKHMTER